MKGIPLDDYFNRLNASMSEEDLEGQLTGDIFSQFNEAIPGVTSPTSPGHAAPTAGSAPAATQAESENVDVGQLLSEALSNAQDFEEQQEQIDVAVKVASHGVKVLSPLLIAASKLVNPEKDPEGLDAMIGAVLQRVRKDALTVVEAYGVSPQDAPSWLVSQVSGQVMQLLVSALERNNGAILDTKDIRYLQPLINHAAEAASIGNSHIAQPANTQLQLIGALTEATAQVMGEHAAFDYFYSDPADVSQQISEFLNERVIEGTLTTLEQQFQMTSDELGYLGNSLIHQAGRTLADAWVSSIPDVLERVKELNKEARRELVLNGAPLDPVFERFESMYQGIEVAAQSALRALAPGRELTLKGGPRLG